MAQEAFVTVDTVWPLGLSCSAAAQCDLRGLRQKSGPVDWIAGTPTETTPDPLDTLRHWITTDFQDFLDNCNFVVQSPEEYDLQGFLTVKDLTSGYVFPHEFRSLPSAEEVLQARHIRQRRWQRFKQEAEQGKRIAVVVSDNGYQVSLGSFEALQTLLERKFPQSTFILFGLRFQCAHAQFHPTVGKSGGIIDIERKHAFRDMSPEASEWSLLNTIRLPPGAVLPEPEASAERDRRNEQVDRSIALEIDRWKRGGKTFARNMRVALEANAARGQGKFRHLPWYYRLLLYLWRKTHRRIFLFCVPSVVGLTAYPPEAH